MISYDEFGILHVGPSYQRGDGVTAGGTFCIGRICVNVLVLGNLDPLIQVVSAGFSIVKSYE